MAAWPAAQQVWALASNAAKSAALAWEASTAKCKGAIAHSAYHLATVCGGFEEEAPTRFTPGFGPLGLAWGWCLVGVLLGLLLGLNFWDIFTRLEQIAQRIEGVRRAGADAPPGLRPMPPWHGMVRDALAVAAEGPRRLVLLRLADEGDAALEFLAAAASVSKRTALARILGEHVVQVNAVAWRL